MTVYVLTYVDDRPYCLTKGAIYMQNKEAFILEDMLEDYTIKEYRRPIYFEDEGEIWFKTLDQAKNHLYDLGYALKSCNDDEWNVIRKEENYG